MNRTTLLSLAALALSVTACDPRPPCPEGFVAHCDGTTRRYCVSVPQTCWTSLDCSDDHRLEEETCSGACLKVETGRPFCALDDQPDAYCSSVESWESVCHDNARLTCRYGYATEVKERCSGTCVEYEGSFNSQTVCAIEPTPDAECRAQTDTVCRENGIHRCVAGYVEEAGEACGSDTCVSPYRYGFCSPHDLPADVCVGIELGETCHAKQLVRCVGGYAKERLNTCSDACVENERGKAFCALSAAPNPVCEEVSSRYDVTCDGRSRVSCRDGFVVEIAETCARACTTHKANDGTVTSACTLSDERDERCENRVAFCDGERLKFSCFDGRVEQTPEDCGSRDVCERIPFGARCT